MNVNTSETNVESRTYYTARVGNMYVSRIYTGLGDIELSEESYKQADLTESQADYCRKMVRATITEVTVSRTFKEVE